MSDRRAASFQKSPFQQFAVLVIIFLSAVYTVPSPFFTSTIHADITPSALGASFVYRPNSIPPSAFCNPYCPFILIGDQVNFTAIASGGLPPYHYAWNFGDGSPVVNTLANSTNHVFSIAGTYSVTLTVTDAALQTSPFTRQVIVQTWPVTGFGWVVPWNITQTDGINIWNATYKGVRVINDVRLAGIQVIYPSNLCGNFGGNFGAFYDEPFEEQAVKADGDIFYESPSGSVPSIQLRAEYRVGGYYYQEAFRFYSNGQWSTEQTIARGGCAFDHIYEPHWRYNLAVENDTHNFMSQYTSTGAWQDLTWEGNYTDAGFRDPANNMSRWRFGDDGRYYYITPTIVRADLDLQYLSPNLVLLRERPYEIERTHPENGIENPVQYINGELAFRRDITFWFIPRIWDHGPVNGAPPKDIILTFYPQGTWP